MAGRAFERQFELADHITVYDRTLVNGLLHVELERQIPKGKKARKIAINEEANENKKAV
ncbi:MAG: Hsp20 family protein [Pseudomonadota bacterium]|nr:Hsp20 family protein [Pseudomonadota bacterium]